MFTTYLAMVCHDLRKILQPVWNFSCLLPCYFFWWGEGGFSTWEFPRCARVPNDQGQKVFKQSFIKCTSRLGFPQNCVPQVGIPILLQTRTYKRVVLTTFSSFESKLLRWILSSSSACFLLLRSYRQVKLKFQSLFACNAFFLCSLAGSAVEFGYEVTCVETEFPDGSIKSRWSISGQKIQLPESWRNIGSAASTVPSSSGGFATQYVWYQLDQSPPARRAGGGRICWFVLNFLIDVISSKRNPNFNRLFIRICLQLFCVWAFE